MTIKTRVSRAIRPMAEFASDDTTALVPSISISPDVLVVDGDELVRSALKLEIESAGYRVATAPSGEAALASLREKFAPLIVLDRNLPHMDGLEVCRQIRAKRFPGYVYIILRTIADDEADVLEGLEAGADEYLSKRISIAQLLARLKTARRILSLETALRMMLAEKRQIAFTDALTGAYNRRYFMKYGERETHRARTAGTELSVLALDIDHFKAINDRYGHGAGDAVLVECVRRIRALLRTREWCARIGGEEFVVVLPRSDLQRALRVGERIREACARLPFSFGSEKIGLTVSIGIGGVGGFRRDGCLDISALLRQADECLYRSKRNGRNKVTMTSPIIECIPVPP